MNRLASALVALSSLFLVVPGLAVAAAPALSPVVTWATATSTQPSTGRVIVYRYAMEFAVGFNRSEYPDRVILVWPYSSDSGMPAVREREAMDRMEDLLQPHVDDVSILAIVSTGENWREWIFYTRSEDEFITRLNRTLREAPAFPIQIHPGPDPTWSSYGKFRSTVKERNAP